MKKRACEFITAEASTKSWFRTNGLIDKYLNITDLNGFRKANTKWSNLARIKYGLEGRLFLEENDKAIPNKAIFQKIDAIKGIVYKTNDYQISPALDNEVQYNLKLINGLEKINRNKFEPSKLQGWLNDLSKHGVTNQQLEIFKQSAKDGMTKDEIVSSILANYSYSVEVNVAKNKIGSNIYGRGSEPKQITDKDFANSIGAEVGDYFIEYITEDGDPDLRTFKTLEEANQAFQTQKSADNSSVYSNLTVPGGINYTENEISTPLITPSIKGHAQFATDKGIGWFRSDDQRTDDNTGKRISDGAGGLVQLGVLPDSKTRRILEAQSDLFQKGRDKENLVNTRQDGNEVFDYKKAKQLINSNSNQFLQLLNKDNNWVKFFVKSIIQDSAKKGYEKVLFPTGNTASKVEGHTTLEEFKKQKEERLEALIDLKEDREKVKYSVVSLSEAGMSRSTSQLIQGDYILREVQPNGRTSHAYMESGSKETVERLKKEKETEFDNEINQLKEELEKVETEGFGALKPIYNFYENTVANILKKQGYTPVVITDEYGNTWNEINIAKERDEQFIALALDTDIELTPAAETTIRHLQNRIFKIRKTLAAETNVTKKYVLEQRMNELTEEIDNIKQGVEDDYLLTIGMKEMNNIERLLNLTTPTFADLVDANTAVAFWSDIKNVIYTAFTPSDGVLGQLQNKAKDLGDQLLYHNQTKLMEDAQSKGFKLQVEQLEATAPDGLRKSYSLTLSNSANKFIQYVDNLLTTTARTRDEIVAGKIKKLQQLTKGLTKAQMNLIFQKDNDGNYTGGRTNEFSQKWFDELKLRKDKRETKLKNAETKKAKYLAHKEWYEFLNKNKVFVNTATFFQEKPDGTKAFSEEEMEAERQSLYSSLGKDSADRLINRAQKLYDEYRTNLEEYKTYLDVQVSSGVITNEEKSSREYEWVTANSPIIFYQRVFEGIDDDSGISNSGKYVASAPLKYQDGKETEWYDKNFEQIQADPRILELYNFVGDIMKDFFDVIPSHVTDKLQSNFIFQVKKDFVERLFQTGMKGAMRGVGQEFIDSITSYDDLDYTNKELDITGKPEKTIPVRFAKPLSAEERSDDLVRIMEAGIAMVENYKLLSKIEAKVVLANQIVQNFDEILINGAGNVVQQGNKPLKIKNGVVALKEQVQYTIDALMYGETKKVEGISSVKLGLSKEDKLKQRELNNAIYNLDVLKENEEISEEEYKTKKDKYLQQLKDIKGKHFNTASFGDMLIKMTQLKAMAYNPFTAVANLGFGMLSNLVHASGNQDYNTKDLTFAFGVMLNTTKKMATLNAWGNDQATKIANIMDRLGIMGDIVDAQYGESTSKKQSKFKSVSPYVWLRNGDFFVKGLTTVAMLNNTKLANGKTLFESMDIEGNFIEENFNEQEKLEWLGNIETEDAALKYKRFKNKAIEVNKMVHGNFDPNSPVLAKKFVLGRLLGQFKLSWMSTGFEARFGSEYHNDVLERDVKGRYRTYQDLVKNKGFLGTVGFTLLNLIKKSVGANLNLKDLKAVDKANFKRNLTELQWLASMAIVILVLKSLKDDDDEDDAMYNLLINQLVRVNQDIYFYTLPSTFTDLTKNVIPATAILNDATKAISGTFKYVFDEDYETELMLKRWTKVFPVTNLYNKYETQTTRLKN